MRLVPTENGGVQLRFDDPAAPTMVRKARRAGRRRTTDAMLREVTEVYRAALAAGDNPTVAVQEHLGCSYRTAGDYVRRARDRGRSTGRTDEFLGESLKRGRKGEAR